LSNFISKPLYCFQIQTGKFGGVVFYFKDVYAKRGNNPQEYTVSFGYEIVSGKVNLNAKNAFIKAIGEILNPLVSNNDSRVFIQWGD